MPWVLDPVFVDRSPARAEFARELIGAQADGHAAQSCRIFRAGRERPSSVSALMAFARAHNRTVVALSGRADLVSDGARIVAIENGDALMARVTAMGCAGSALLAAYLAVERGCIHGERGGDADARRRRRNGGGNG